MVGCGVRLWVVAAVLVTVFVVAIPFAYITAFVDLRGVGGSGVLRPEKVTREPALPEAPLKPTAPVGIPVAPPVQVERPPLTQRQETKPTLAAVGDVRKVGVWDMKVEVKHKDAGGHPRHFVYESWIPGSAFRVPMPVVLDDGDRGGWVGREHPYGGCSAIDGATCKKSGSGFGSVAAVHTFASFTRMPSTPCVRHDFGDEIKYHAISRSAPAPDADELLENAVGGMKPADSCEESTLVPLLVPQGAYFAHFMDGVFPRLAAALALREARGLPEKLHIILYGAYKSDDTERTLAALPNVTVSFGDRVPIGVCYKRIVSVCYHTPGVDPRASTEINRFVRNAFYKENRPAESDFASVMSKYHHPGHDTRAHRHSLAGANPLHPSPTCTTRVYAGRKRNNRNGRSTPNENEIIAHLKDAYNFTVFVGGESLAQWSDAMKDACIFIGAHGGALSHMFWLNPDLNPAVIEFDGYNKYTVFWYLAATMGFNYGWMGFDRSRGVDLKRLDMLMEKFNVLPISPNATHNATTI